MRNDPQKAHRFHHNSEEKHGKRPKIEKNPRRVRDEDDAIQIKIRGETMTKTEEFEKKLIENGMSENDYAEYEKLLNKVHDEFLCLQHCYITAIQFPLKRSDQAIKLIEWGLKKYLCDWFPTYTAYSSDLSEYCRRVRFPRPFLPLPWQLSQNWIFRLRRRK